MTEPTFDDLLPLAAVRTAPGEYDIMSSDGRRLWFMEGASLADWVCQSVNGYAAMLATMNLRSPKTQAELCGDETHKGHGLRGCLDCKVEAAVLARNPATSTRLLSAEELLDIERFQKQRRKSPVPADAWIYVAEIDRLLTHIRLEREQIENEIFEDGTDPNFAAAKNNRPAGDAFEKWWAIKKAEGYQYGPGPTATVRFGFEAGFREGQKAAKQSIYRSHTSEDAR
jgi:hypothetical protein